MSDQLKIITSKNGVETVQEFTVLDQPLTSAAMDAAGWVKGVVSVDTSELLNYNLERFLDRLSELLVGNDLLCDFGWKVLGLDPDNEDHLYIEVSGEANLAFANDP